MLHIKSPDISDPAIEREILAKGLTAPRVTPDAIEENIVSFHYFTAAEAAWGDTYLSPEHEGSPLHLLTFCVLVLRNGFMVTGESACASPENFNDEVGQKIARANAVNKIWPLMGYQLKQRLHEEAAGIGALNLP